MSCKAARPSDEGHGWHCSITGDSCAFLSPDSKQCAELYGEGPDAKPDLPAVGQEVFAIVKSHSTFQLYITAAKVVCVLGDTLVLERPDTPLSSSRWTFPAHCWGTEVFGNSQDAQDVLEERERCGQ